MKNFFNLYNEDVEGVEEDVTEESVDQDDSDDED